MGTEGFYSLPKATGSKCNHLLFFTFIYTYLHSLPQLGLEYVKIDIYMSYWVTIDVFSINEEVTHERKMICGNITELRNSGKFL